MAGAPLLVVEPFCSVMILLRLRSGVLYGSYGGCCWQVGDLPHLPAANPVTSIKNPATKTKENHDRAERFDDEQRCTGHQRTQLPDPGRQRPDPAARRSVHRADGALQPRAGA